MYLTLRWLYCWLCCCCSSPSISWQNISGGEDWLGYQSGKAWVYRSGGQYRTAAPPPGQGVPYGAGYSSGDNITAIIHNATTLEFLKNSATQGLVHLQVALPPDVIGCASMCNGGSLAMMPQSPTKNLTNLGKTELQACSKGSPAQQWKYDMTSATFLNPGGLAEPGFLSLAAKPTGTNFAAVVVSSNPGYPLFWAPPTNFIRYDNVGDLGAPGGTTNMCVGVCGSGGEDAP